ncbi:inositol polyphosphate multikinase [Brachionus plicatilis]|uniref:Kinase n=1 Tax=Brachionus plicatilis TaxID=10195 RepID=A0A3M7T7P5_BRAPC|nr:inositol polyphosphate multikinase [Brachionus plicatilis]
MVESSVETIESTERKSQDLTLKECMDPLPNNCFPLVHQVAGHFYGKGRTKLGLLQTPDGLVLKPVQSPPRGEREHNFFKRLFLSDESELNQDEVALRSLCPTYRGSLIHNDIIYIKMDDMAYGFKHPAVIDYKIGRVTYDPEASQEKIARQIKKYPPVEKTGFQLIGMRVFNKEDATFCHYDKSFGRNLSEQELIHGLALYYQFHQTPQIRAIKETIGKFEEIKAWFEKQRTYHFYASSLIVIYEACLEDMVNQDATNLTKANENEMNNNGLMLADHLNSVRIVMADFAHVFPANDSLDLNYLYGLNRLIEHLKLLISPDYKFKDVRLKDRIKLKN